MENTLDNPRTVLLRDGSGGALGAVADRLAQLLPHAWRWTVGQDWTAGEQPSLVIMAVAPERASAVLSELDRRRLDVACACPPGRLADFPRLRQRVRHIHSCLLVPWRYHWTICRLREILSCGLLGDDLRGELIRPNGAGQGILSLGDDCLEADFGQWLGDDIAWTASARQEGSDWRLTMTGSRGVCSLAFREDGWGDFRGESAWRRTPWSDCHQGLEVLAAALGAFGQAVPTAKGWTGFPLIR